MKRIIFVLAFVLFISSKQKSDYAEITFYSEGKKVMQIETASDYYTTLPIKTTTGKYIHADSLTVKIKQ